MSKRKTIDILPMLEWANRQLARNDEYSTREFKAGVATTIETILHNANCYCGFMFLGTDTSVYSNGYYDRVYFKPNHL
jgi:hypothetical protein